MLSFLVTQDFQYEKRCRMSTSPISSYENIYFYDISLFSPHKCLSLAVGGPPPVVYLLRTEMCAVGYV
jgi:hypothetical protein